MDPDDVRRLVDQPATPDQMANPDLWRGIPRPGAMPMDPDRWRGPHRPGAIPMDFLRPLTTERGRSKQIAGKIRDALTSGHLRQGEQLPGSEMLGRRYGVSDSTVTRAFRLLQADGLVRVTPRGTFVRVNPAMCRGETDPQEHELT